MAKFVDSYEECDQDLEMEHQIYNTFGRMLDEVLLAIAIVDWALSNLLLRFHLRI